MIHPCDGRTDRRAIAYTHYSIYAVARKKNEKTDTETNASAHLVRYRFKIRGGSPEGRKSMEERIYERDEF